MLRYKKIAVNSGLISFGNTGARLADPRAIYINILKAIIEFRTQNKGWSNLDQIELGKKLKTFGIFEIKENNIIGADKDVRLKTGFISQLGFTTEKRKITEVGKDLLLHSKTSEINKFDISKESYTYLKQFLKYQQKGFEILPILSLIYAIIDFENELPIDFITYIWAGSQTKKELIENIGNYKKEKSYKYTVYKSIYSSENTKIAKENIDAFFDNYTISDKIELQKLLYEILPHGKGDSYKNKAIALFYDIYDYWNNKKNWQDSEKRDFIEQKIKSRYKDISSKKPSYFLEFLFDTTIFNKKSNWGELISYFEKTPLISAKSEQEFILNFHVFYMYIKKLSVCEEYRDLNLRHLKLLDIFIFEQDTVKIDIVFWYIFKSVKNKFLEVCPISDEEMYRENLEKNHQNMGDIYDFLNIEIVKIVEQIAIDYPEIKSIGLQNFAQKRKEERLSNLVNQVFTKENIITIFESIYPRNDDKIREIIKNLYQEYEATIPALFEYLLAISFYWLSDKKVKLSDILHSNLDVNLLPKTHTGGGKADVVINYKGKDYLIEATLSENDGQRKMEAEPVPRHLARHILDVNPNSWSIFIAGKLEPNNLVVLRGYKILPWYYSENDNIETMDILPLSISNMIYLLKSNKNLDEIQISFEKLLDSETIDGFKWYKEEINKTFEYEN